MGAATTLRMLPNMEYLGLLYPLNVVLVDLHQLWTLKWLPLVFSDKD